ncbi:hypothetical protein [Haliangium sp. UPWRP_2]|uniref:hypothetical protein n=1 Tax=Haliangium sp. UPWRP_2 TaxID=1931276 RepID=UPI001E527327|nr:hypothetical protein [Haliangium sp. UPWRP_2]
MPTWPGGHFDGGGGTASACSNPGASTSPRSTIAARPHVRSLIILAPSSCRRAWLAAPARRTAPSAYRESVVAG